MSDYWDEQFSGRAEAHSDQNKDISKDFLSKLTPDMNNIFLASRSIIEIGCGTGELSRMISDKYNKNTLGTDLSSAAIEFANSHYSNNLTTFNVLDIMNDNINVKYDLAICSNILEHFRNPQLIINKILQCCHNLIILVPYNQPAVDGYDHEGGAGHVFQFTEKSFDQYNTLNWFTFRTNGWQHSSRGEVPLQLAIAIK